MRPNAAGVLRAPPRYGRMRTRCPIDLVDAPGERTSWPLRTAGHRANIRPDWEGPRFPSQPASLPRCLRGSVLLPLRRKSLAPEAFSVIPPGLVAGALVGITVDSKRTFAIGSLRYSLACPGLVRTAPNVTHGVARSSITRDSALTKFLSSV